MVGGTGVVEFDVVRSGVGVSDVWVASMQVQPICWLQVLHQMYLQTGSCSGE